MNLAVASRDFIALWVVLDPVGTIPVFLAATAGMDADMRRAVATRGILVATGILLFFLVAGQFLLEAMGISLVSFQIAGGLILLLFALKMMFDNDVPNIEGTGAPASDPMQVAVFPVGIPSIAGPGALLTIVLLTDNYRFDIIDQVYTALIMGAVLVVLFAALMMAAPIHQMIGKGGENIVSRVMGMVLAAVAVDTVLHGFELLGWIDPSLLSTPL